MNKPLFLLLLAIGACAASCATARADDDADTASADDRFRRRALAAIEASEPGVADTRAAALRHAGLDDRRGRGWARRSRLAGLLPSLTLRATHKTSSDEDISRASSGSERLAVGSDEDLGYEARATFDLDRLVFDSAEIRAARTAQQLHRVRLEIGARVASVYYRRRKLQVALIWSPPRTEAEAIARRLEIEETAAELDALTGGWWSKQTRR